MNKINWVGVFLAASGVSSILSLYFIIMMQLSIDKLQSKITRIEHIQESSSCEINRERRWFGIHSTETLGCES